MNVMVLTALMQCPCIKAAAKISKKQKLLCALSLSASMCSFSLPPGLSAKGMRDYQAMVRLLSQDQGAIYTACLHETVMPPVIERS